MQGLEALYSRYANTLVSVNAIDDSWASPCSRDAFMPYYKNAKHTVVDLVPNDYGLQKIQHMGYFFKHAHTIWTPIFECFDVELYAIKNNNS
jgi:predicted alpha/beta hydrolase